MCGRPASTLLHSRVRRDMRKLKALGARWSGKAVCIIQRIWQVRAAQMRCPVFARRSACAALRPVICAVAPALAATSALRADCDWMRVHPCAASPATCRVKAYNGKLTVNGLAKTRARGYNRLNSCDGESTAMSGPSERRAMGCERAGMLPGGKFTPELAD